MDRCTLSHTAGNSEHKPVDQGKSSGTQADTVAERSSFLPSHLPSHLVLWLHLPGLQVTKEVTPQSWLTHFHQAVANLLIPQPRRQTCLLPPQATRPQARLAQLQLKEATGGFSLELQCARLFPYRTPLRGEYHPSTLNLPETQSPTDRSLAVEPGSLDSLSDTSASPLNTTNSELGVQCGPFTFYSPG